MLKRNTGDRWVHIFKSFELSMNYSFHFSYHCHEEQISKRLVMDFIRHFYVVVLAIGTVAASAHAAPPSQTQFDNVRERADEAFEELTERSITPADDVVKDTASEGVENPPKNIDSNVPVDDHWIRRVQGKDLNPNVPMSLNRSERFHSTTLRLTCLQRGTPRLILVLRGLSLSGIPLLTQLIRHPIWGPLSHELSTRSTERLQRATHS